MARNATLIATSAAGLAAIGLAFFFGASFTEKLTNGYSLGMAVSFAAALACYAIIAVIPIAIVLTTVSGYVAFTVPSHTYGVTYMPALTGGVLFFARC